MQTLPNRLKQSRTRLASQARLFLVQTREAGGDLAGDTRRATDHFLKDTRKAGKAFVLKTRRASAGFFGATRDEARRWRVFIEEVRPGNRLQAPKEPFEGYDELAARDLVKRIAKLSPAEAGAVQDYEQANRGRVTVLKAAQARTAA